MRNSIEHVLATIFDYTIARESQFLYTIYGLLDNQATLYVGQTRAKTGPLGRLTQHLSDAAHNTYLQRLSAIYDYEQIPLARIDFAAIRFTPVEMFQLNSPVYREAVEDSVQKQLLNLVADQKLAITIVSRTHGNPYSKLPNIQKEAKRIYVDLEPWILECHTMPQ